MRTTILTAGFALFSSFGVQAQNDATMPIQGKGDKHACIMAGADAWTSLGLTNDQIAKVKEIQAVCQKDYDVSKADGSAATSVAKHEEDLKTVLSPDQYNKWVQWCDEQQASKGKEDEKSPTTPTK